MMNEPTSSFPPFGQWLKRLRAEQDLTQEALAEQVACSVQTIRFFETGKRRPSVAMAERLTQVLQVPADQSAHFVRSARTPLPPGGPPSTPDPTVAAAPLTTIGSTVPAGAIPPVRYQPPLPATELIGREPETTLLLHLLTAERRRLVTIVGPGGIGKTRLALHVAHTLVAGVENQRMATGSGPATDAQPKAPPDLDGGARLFQDGVLFVPLAALSSVARISSAVASAMQQTVSGAGSPAEQLTSLLGGQALLLVLDNVEHLLALASDQFAGLLDHLLQHVPGVHCLLTSRERLRMAGEHVLDLGGLALPAHSETLLPAGSVVATEGETESMSLANAMAESEAIQLFVQRARQVMPTFALTPSNQQAILRICAAVGGMPLGIELAAAWTRTLTPAEIAHEIAGSRQHSLDFLGLHDRSAPSRHRSLRAVFEHSWTLLTPAEQATAAQLAVFRGGFEREAAREVAGADLVHLASLIDKSLVQTVESTPPGSPPETEQAAHSRESTRAYQIHELLRQFLLDKLHSAVPEPDAEAHTQRRHAVYYAGLAEKIEQHLYAHESIAWRRRGEAEQGNLRAALAWCITHSNDPVLGLRLAGALGRFWYLVGLWQEGCTWLEAALAQAGPDAPPALRAQALAELGILQHALSELPAAQENLESALTLWLALDDLKKQAWTLFQQGILASTRGDKGRAETLFEQSLQHYRQLDEPWYIATVLMQLAGDVVLDGDSARAIQLLDEVMPIYRQANHRGGIGVVLNLQGWALLMQQQPAAARRHFAQALDIGNQHSSPQLIAWSRRNLGVVELLAGNYAEAADHLRACLSIYQQMSHKSAAIVTFEALAALAAAQEGGQGTTVHAVRLLAAAEALRMATEQPRTAFEEEIYYRRTVDMTRDRLDLEAWQRAWDEGSALSLDAVFALALGEFPPDTAGSFLSSVVT